MPKQIYSLSLLLTLTAATHAAAEAPAAPPLQTVEIGSSRNEQRRLDPAATLVIGRDELLRYGDQSLTDVLKRVPGISIGGVPGRATEILMRGLGNGYTQILLNGVAVPKDFSINTLSPEQIEKIEILRVASAELGAQAIAGTINIVLRKSVARAQQEIKLGLGRSNGELSPELTLQLSDKGVAYSYTAVGTLADNRALSNFSDAELETGAGGAIDLQRLIQRREQTQQRSLNLSPRINWNLEHGDSLSSQNFLRLLDFDIRAHLAEQTAIGQPTEFPLNDRHFRAHAATLRSDLQWKHKLAGDQQLEIKGGLSHFQRSSDYDFWGEDSIARAPAAHQVASDAIENGLTFSAKFTQELSAAHTLVLGGDLAHSRRSESRLEHLFLNGQPTGGSDETYAASLQRLALYAQDEWSVSPAWTLSSGLRAEALRSHAEGSVLDSVSQQTRVLSPLLQARYKLSDSHQFRFGLSRTFKAPTLIQLAQRRYTTDNNNNPNNPDSQGNPYLRAERAWGLDLAYEYYFDKGGLLSASVYSRSIDDVTVDHLFQQGATWISVPRNAGHASTQGLELEAKLPLRAVVPDAPDLDLRANFSRNWSRVDSIAGPDNRLDSQVPLSLNLGFDQRLASAPLSLGANFSWQGGGQARQSEFSSDWSSVKRELELYGVWRCNPRTQLRLAATNLLQQDHLTLNRYTDGARDLRSSTRTPTAATYRLVWEYKFGG